MILSVVCCDLQATTPTEKLESVTNQLIVIALSSQSNDDEKKTKLSQIIRTEIDLETISRKVLSTHWEDTTEEQKQYFMSQFEKIIVKNYFALLKKYTNEKIVFTKEQVKEDRLAIVDSEIVSGSSKTPVRYKMVKVDNTWKIYDFAPEGVSFVTSYKNNYAITLRESGVQGLVDAMSK